MHSRRIHRLGFFTANLGLLLALSATVGAQSTGSNEWRAHGQTTPAARRMAGPPRVAQATQAPAAPANRLAEASASNLAVNNLPARPTVTPAPAAGLPVPTGALAPDEHPLAPALRWAQDGVTRIGNIRDYSCTMIKRERIDGELLEHQYMFMKVRHQPFSVYLYFLKPDKIKGQECIYVEGANDGNLFAHGSGLKERVIGTVSLNPTSMLAMKDNRYPITKIGMHNLVKELLEIGSHDTQFGECDVQFYKGVKLTGRTCTMMQVTHPTPRRNFRFHIARIVVDDELNLPVRYEAYTWPTQAGGKPVLEEEYTYQNLKLNNGFTDADFDVRNPSYRFK